ncbi:Asp-tRNA(Asn)/Glu-tRNA(Gln) amidotransferase subunit GatC [Desulfovibrio inopinatus]|uniref:Asp-tRNA(Asn)/Glu-tRNA(Gln) amidotransferase subunit GatC n=1 Tax=Desulfovibrio inopinatus TaxID=102109 RepID=UPI0004210D9D|nr:Asp-tRNA(Asn)/Glu-tRNA(Gln) amidotransferase subunit GatC [Desulfovibrio inopinatus]
MNISKDEAAKVAKLARLRLDDDKLALFAGQMDDILGHMAVLNELDTENVDPLYSPVAHSTPYRKDEAFKTTERSDVLANAPEDDGQFFIVPRIV